MVMHTALFFVALAAGVLGQSADQYSAHSYNPNEQYGRPQPYDFGYEVKDEHGSVQSRQEKADESGAVKGAYAYSDASGIYRQVEYVADEGGFRVNVKTNEPGTSNQSPADVVITAAEPPANLFVHKIATAPAYQPRPAVVGVRPAVKVVTPVQTNYVGASPYHVLTPAASEHVLVKTHGTTVHRQAGPVGYGPY